MAASLTKFVFSLLTLLPLLLPVQTDGTIGSDAIFGVRWFLGQKFRFQEPLPHVEDETPSCHLMLIFNSHLSWSTHRFSVEIANTKFWCAATRVVQYVSSDHHEEYNEVASKLGDIFITYVHKCPVTFPGKHLLEHIATLPYTILALQGEQKQILLEAVLRSPVYDAGELSMAVIGDWGLMTTFSQQSKISKPITDCLRTQAEQRQDLRLLLLLGDLAYDLQGQSYVNFLSQLSVFSSHIVIMLTPGNHESIRHQDIYLLFKESFYSPSWNRFYGYFDLVVLRNHLFLGYNPEHIFPWLSRTSHSSLFEVYLKEEFHNFTNMFSLQFPPETKAAIREMTVISFSHYPTYCSKKDQYEDCNKYRQLHGALTEELQDLGVDLFLAGHVHMYERTKQLCGGQSNVRAGVQRDGIYEFWREKGCSVFVIDGAGGNNYFVEAGQSIQLEHFSQKFAGNTGFGILTLNSSIFNDLHFVHLSVDEGCWPVDEFILHVHAVVASEAPRSTSRWLIVAIVCVTVAALLVMRKTVYGQVMRWVDGKQCTQNDIELTEDDAIH